MTMQSEEATFDDVTEFTPVFDDGTYILTVVRIEATDGQYGPGLKWIFHMTNQATGQQVKAPGGGALTASGYPEPYEWFQFSSKKVTPKTKVYPWIAAFLGRPPSIGESGSGLVRAVKGTSAVAMVGVPANDPGGRQKILTIKPVTAAAPPTPRPAPSPTPTPQYTAQGEPIAEDDEEATLLAQLEETRKRKAAANQAKAGVTEESYQALFGNQVPA